MRWVLIVFLALYAIALVLFLIGTFGLFGSPQGPLAGVFLIPIGLPWNIIADRAGLAPLAAGILSPAINALIIYLVWRKFA